MMVIKCNVCKLDIATCNCKCMEMDDVSVLFRDGKTEKDAFEGFCTNHSCPHNPTGFKCALKKCVHIGEDGDEGV